MNYKEALLFTGKCLTLGIQSDMVSEIRETIRNGSVEWEKIVKLSSGHLVLPALFIQLQRAELLNELPDDLIEYMNSLTQLNRERNQQILNQVNDISFVLNRNQIFPIYLKGVAHLLLPLYEDIGERMVGDIDFLMEEANMLKTVELLVKEGYTPMAKYYPDMLSTIKHYPRLANYKYPAAVEVHIRITRPPHDKKLSYGEINKDKQLLPSGTAYALSDHHQIIHNMMHAQIDNKAFSSGTISLRAIYDLLYLSRRKDPLETARQFGHFPRHFNAYLMVASKIFDSPSGINFQKNRHARRYSRWIQFNIDHPSWHSTLLVVLFVLRKLGRYITVPIKSIYNKGERKRLMNRLGDRTWYKNHLASYRNFRN